MPASFRHAAWLAALLTFLPFCVEAQDRRATPWNPCTPCAELVDLVDSRRRVAAGSFALTPRLPSFETLGWIPFDRVLRADRIARECLAGAGVAAGGREAPSCSPSADEVRDFLDDLQRIRGRFEQLHSERLSFTRLVALLPDPARRLGRNSRWPAAGVCVDCDAVWASLEGVLELQVAARLMLRSRIGRAHQAALALGKMRPLKSELCRHRRILFEFDRDGFALDYQYLTWTESWKAFEVVHRALGDNLVARLCR